MVEIITALILLAGGIFAFIASVGMLRLPDTIIRMHAATKAGALGSGLIFIALACYYLELSTTLRALATVFFLLLTAPVAAHLIGRAAYCSRVNLWHKTWIDEFANVCDWCETSTGEGASECEIEEK
ncbi:MAG: monovalent cation/H(+) antiporter subunit G [Desulfobacterales bacterium]|nr:monovalent cation/H(+) antiporter subunit G [Desulfobacterales bacterium]